MSKDDTSPRGDKQRKMFLVLPLLSDCATWSEITTNSNIGYESIRKTLRPDLKPHISQEPKLYQNKKISAKINDDVPFVGIANCTFESITNLRGGIISLKGSALTIQDTKFTKVENTYALELEYCSGILISSTEFSNFKNAGGIHLVHCNDISLYSAEFRGFDNTESIDGQVDNSAILFSECTGSIICTTIFENNNLLGSLFVMSKCGRITLNECQFLNNHVVYPGNVFICSSDFITIQNTIFKNNVAETHSAAIYSIFSVTSLYHILFSGNKVEPTENYPSPVSYISNGKLAVVVTIDTSSNIDSTIDAVYLKDLCFEKSGSKPGAASFIAVEMKIDTRKISYEGIIETTSSSDDAFYLGSSYENIKTSVTSISYYKLQEEPFSSFIDYGIQPLLPEIRYKKIAHNYESSSIVNVDGPFAFIAIDSCTFDGSHIYSESNDDDATLIHIDMNYGGSVSVTNSIFEDNKVRSSVIDILNAKRCSISECTFSYNTARQTAGALIVNTEEVRICGNSFEKNDPVVRGTIALYNVSDALLIQNVFRKNTGNYGCSSLIIQDSNVRINDTLFIKNNLDFNYTNLDEESFFDMSQTKYIGPHNSIPGIDTKTNISVAIAAYGNSKIQLYNVAFSDSENEADNFTSKHFNITAIDGYAEPTVKITGSKTCTDTANYAFYGNWNVPFNDDECDIGPYYRHIETYSPVYANVTKYEIQRVGNSYSVKQTQSMGVHYDPENRVDCPVSVDEYDPVVPDYPEPEKPDAVVEKSSKAALIIIILFICATVVILICTAIYFCRTPPEDRLDDDEENNQRKTGLLDEEEDEKDNEGLAI